IGYETVLAKCLFFTPEKIADERSSNVDFDFNGDYAYLEDIFDPEKSIESNENRKSKKFCLLEFDHPILCPPDCLYIASKLDMANTNLCRLAFHGRILRCFATTTMILEKQPQQQRGDDQIVKNLKIFKIKTRNGYVERMVDDYTVIANGLFKKQTNFDAFVNLKVKLSTGEIGYIESHFGQSGKAKIRLMGAGLLPATVELLKLKSDSKNKKKSETIISNDSVESVKENFPAKVETEEEFDEEEEESTSKEGLEDEDEAFPKEYRTLEVNSVSLRTDVVAKNLFNISRSKAEDLIMATKIRVNGKNIKDKSSEVKSGDTLDMFLNINEDNPKNSDISRAQILSIAFNPSSKILGFIDAKISDASDLDCNFDFICNWFNGTSGLEDGDDWKTAQAVTLSTWNHLPILSTNNDSAGSCLEDQLKHNRASKLAFSADCAESQSLTFMATTKFESDVYAYLSGPSGTVAWLVSAEIPR
uniref:RNA-binding S4 domain-containing protein n=1 Tax=Romanomermis culicivorax TaxID=13658 RepID=A0A915HKC6_ROMCU